MNLLSHLRAAIRHEHQMLEEYPNLLAPVSAKDRFVAALEALWGFHAVFDPSLGRFPQPAPLLSGRSDEFAADADEASVEDGTVETFRLLRHRLTAKVPA